MDITKFSEFINSNILIFNETYKIMFLETAHLSSTDSIRENKNYKDIVLMGNKIIPHIMNEILNNDGNIILYFLVEDITGIFIDNDSKGIKSKLKELYKKWWDINEHNF